MSFTEVPRIGGLKRGTPFPRCSLLVPLLPSSFSLSGIPALIGTPLIIGLPVGFLIRLVLT
jgi:hypothetical protein